MERKYKYLIITVVISNITLIALIVALAWGAGIVKALNLPLASQEATVPSLMRYEGSTTAFGGRPLGGTRPVTFRIYDAATGGILLWEEVHSSITFDRGRFVVVLGSQGSPVTSDLFTQPDRWIEMEVAGEVLSTRLQFAAVPYAFNTDRLNGKTESELLDSIPVSGGLPGGAVVWFREGSDPTGFTRMTGTLGVDIGPWETLASSPEDTHPYDCQAWTGSEILCWNNWRIRGARYDLASDSWSSMTTAGSPISRSLYSLVWAGSDLIVWGGSSRSEGNYLNDGGRYDPVGDSWSSIATADAPSPRGGHAAVWAGSEMIVWGGYESYSGNAFNTGARYDPAVDSWTPMTTANAPISRSYPVAVWTGSEVIILGGVGSDYQNLKSGGRYDPVTDTWLPTNATGAPTLYSQVNVAWTGTEVVVGPETDPYLYFYNPTTDTWRKVVRHLREQADSSGYFLSSPLVAGDLLLTGDGVYDLSEDKWLALANESVTAMMTIWTGNEVLAMQDSWGAPTIKHTIDVIIPYVKD